MKTIRKSTLLILMLTLALCMVFPSKVEAKAKWKKAYMEVLKKENQENGSACRYKLIAFDKDKIPELVVGVDNSSVHWIKMYSYKNGKLYTVMDTSYYFVGEDGPEYLAKRNYMRYRTTMYSNKAIVSIYNKIKNHKMVNLCNDGFLTALKFIDKNGNDKYDKGEETKNYSYYLNNKKISKKKYKSYCKKGYYKSMTPHATYATMVKRLK